MKVLRTGTNIVYRDALNRILKVRPDDYIAPSDTDGMIEVRVDNGTVFTLPTFTGYTYNATVDWGDGTATSTITAWNDVDIVHTYVNEGTYLIIISGTFQAFAVNNNVAIRSLITRVISWGTLDFRLINLYGCSALTFLPEQAGKLTAVTSFANFCNGCVSLIRIPYGIFHGNSIALTYQNAFYNCTAIKVLYADMFRDAVNATTFNTTFYGCSALLDIPTGLFTYNSKVTSCANTFQACTKIASIPASLFQSFIYNCSFSNCFYSCTSITAIPAGLFTGVKVITAYSTFMYCSGITSLPDNLFKDNITCTDFTYTFYQCLKIPYVPENTFPVAPPTLHFIIRLAIVTP